MTSAERVRDEQGERPTAAWYHRVLPLCGLVIVLIALGAFAVPPFRHQVALSLSRQSSQYVELYFARQPSAGGQAVCVRHGSTVGVRFVVTSHLDHAESIPYRVVVVPTAHASRRAQHVGRVSTRPTRATGTLVRLRAERGPYVVSVLLPSQDQQIRARCGGRSS